MTDRLALIKARHAEAGGGDGDLAWLVAEVERLRADIQTALIHHDKGDIEDVASVLDEALNSGKGVYQP